MSSAAAVPPLPPARQAQLDGFVTKLDAWRAGKVATYESDAAAAAKADAKHGTKEAYFAHLDKMVAKKVAATEAKLRGGGAESLAEQAMRAVRCRMEACSVLPEAKALYFNWNGREQFTGITNLAGVHTLLDDIDGPLNGPGRVLSGDEVWAHLVIVGLANVDRVPDDGRIALDDLHFDASVPANAARLRLTDEERGWPRVERATDGTLAATPRVGDTVKVALNVAALFDALPQGDGPANPGYTMWLAQARRNHAAEMYWAHVLSVEPNEELGELRLTVLSPTDLKYLPSKVASEPYTVLLHNVYAVHPGGVRYTIQFEFHKGNGFVR